MKSFFVIETISHMISIFQLGLMILLIVFQLETFNILLIYFHDVFILWLTYKSKTLSENEKNYTNKSLQIDNENSNNIESFIIEKNEKINKLSFSKLISWILLLIVTGLVLFILTLEIFYEEKLILTDGKEDKLFNLFRILYFSFLLFNFIISIDFIRTNLKTVEVLKKSSKETDNINCFDYLKKHQIEESFRNESKGNKVNNSSITNKNKERIKNPFVFKTFSNINDDYNFIMNFNQESFKNDNTNSSFNFNNNKEGDNNVASNEIGDKKDSKNADSKLTESMISITNKFQFHKETYFKTRIRQLNVMSIMNLIYIFIFITYTILKVTLFDDNMDYKILNQIYIIPTSTKSIIVYFLFQLSNCIPIIISLVVFFFLIMRDLKQYDDEENFEKDYIIENKCNNCSSNTDNNENNCNESHHNCYNTEVYNVHDSENKNQIYLCNEHKYISFSTNHKTLSLRNSKDEYFEDIKYQSDNVNNNKDFDRKSVKSKKSKNSKNSDNSNEKRKSKNFYLNSLKSNSRLTEGEKFLLD